MDSQFDVLAKTIALAGGMPRREAVRRVGGALALAGLSWLGVGCSGGTGGGGSSPMSPLPPGTSATGGRTPQGGGNSDCAHFCQQAFPPGPQRGQCVSDGANGTGLCVQCAGDVSRLCAPSGGGAYVCCAAGQSCCSGTCLNVQTDANNCGSCGNKCATKNSVCTSGACVCPSGTTNTNGKCTGPCGCPPGYFCTGGGIANIACCPSGGGVCCAPDQC